MSARQDPTRRDELLFMLLHGGAASNSIARYVADAAIAEALAEQAAELDKLKAALSGAADQIAALESELGKALAQGSISNVPQQRGESR
ncbi:hypothetical protein [Streptomyces sp. NPDC047972]|uniref:hypothetical protein n=1 Tax=Streptomyces sp. NPDC047972 TaxID=3365493 RepID=UPI00371ED4D7